MTPAWTFPLLLMVRALACVACVCSFSRQNNFFLLQNICVLFPALPCRAAPTDGQSSIARSVHPTPPAGINHGKDVTLTHTTGDPVVIQQWRPARRLSFPAPSRRHGGGPFLIGFAPPTSPPPPCNHTPDQRATRASPQPGAARTSLGCPATRSAWRTASSCSIPAAGRCALTRKGRPTPGPGAGWDVGGGGGLPAGRAGAEKPETENPRNEKRETSGATFFSVTCARKLGSGRVLGRCFWRASLCCFAGVLRT